MPQSKKGAIRALTGQEIWRMHGGSREEWRAEPKEGREALVKRAVASCPPRTAEAVLTWATEIFRSGKKVGACHDPEEEAAWKAVQRWLRAWKSNPERPLEKWEALTRQRNRLEERALDTRSYLMMVTTIVNFE